MQGRGDTSHAWTLKSSDRLTLWCSAAVNGTVAYAEVHLIMKFSIHRKLGGQSRSITQSCNTLNDHDSSTLIRLFRR